MSNKALNKIEAELTDQIKLMQKPENETNLYLKVNKYNAMVEGIQNYYRIENNFTIDFNKLQYYINTLSKNRLNVKKGGEINDSHLLKRYGKSKQMRWIGYCKSRNPMYKKVSINQYTPDGRKELYKPPNIDVKVMHYIMCNPIEGRAIEYNDNRVSLYVGQKGKCAITGQAL